MSAPDHQRTSSTSSCETDAEGSEASHPPLIQLSLRDSFIEAGSRLQSSNPELFASAISQLSAQFSLAVARNPEFLCSAANPSEANPATKESSLSKKPLKRGRSVRSKPADADGEEVQESLKRMTYHKYTLPGDAKEHEYYQCMTCKEKRRENSFYSNHMHLGEKPVVRWYCPLCNDFFAVTHRSGHIRNRHSDCAECTSPCPTNLHGTGSPSADLMMMDRRVAMIAAVTAEAVVSAAATRSAPPSPLREQAVLVQPKVEEGFEQECYQPLEKRSCHYSDDQTTAFSGYSGTQSPVNESVVDPCDPPADMFSNAYDSDSSCSNPFQTSNSPSSVGDLDDDAFPFLS